MFIINSIKDKDVILIIKKDIYVDLYCYSDKYDKSSLLKAGSKFFQHGMVLQVNRVISEQNTNGISKYCRLEYDSYVIPGILKNDIMLFEEMFPEN